MPEIGGAEVGANFFGRSHQYLERGLSAHGIDLQLGEQRQNICHVTGPDLEDLARYQRDEDVSTKSLRAFRLRIVAGAPAVRSAAAGGSISVFDREPVREPFPLAVGRVTRVIEMADFMYQDVIQVKVPDRFGSPG